MSADRNSVHDGKVVHELIDGQDVAKVAHIDGTVDYIDANAVGGDLEDMPKGYYYSPAFLGTMVAICCASICAYLGWVLPANTLSLINADLGNSPDINWVATVWTLGSCIGFLLIGRLSDIFGRKWMVMGTTVLSLVGCIVGAVAKNVNTLIGANLLNGLSAAGQLSFGITLGELVPNKHRGVVVTICFLSSLPFAVFGPIIARSFINNTAAGWRWSYYIGIILNGITAILFFFLYHPPSYTQLHVAGKTRWQAVKEIDYVGIFLFVGGCVLFLIGLSWGGTIYPWASVQTLCTLLIGFATIVAFVIWEAYFCKVQPLMPPRLFKNKGFVGIVIVATIGAMIYYSMTVLWPTIVGTLYTTDSLQIGWQSSVVGGGILLGQVLGGLALGYVPRVKTQAVIASICAMAFITPLASITTGTHNMFLALGILGLVSIGYVDNITFPGVTLVQESQDIGLATGVMGSIRALGGAVAQALYVSVLNNKLTTNIPKYVGPAATEAGLPDSSLPALYAGITAGNFSAVPDITPAVEAAVGASLPTAYAESFKIVFYCTIPFSVILIAAAFLVPNMEPYLHLNVAKKLQTRANIQAAEKNATIDQEKANVVQAETAAYVEDAASAATVPLESVAVPAAAAERT
ncbi:siderophore iron transporter [Sporothrix brasiliensis 5110]|uniref:Siderophore iron transporter n=1 Tax=Sporothrix brasiliensis 5110 TaxID=1398154 RepID=A0A0C2FTH5_9PEZI|nr:siderophore iron transporter [Sporothrix brasiliensis 5110]KIH94343.1 siderophore iron transporter [Sporothrix brasiliensis 5110]